MGRRKVNRNCFSDTINRSEMEAMAHGSSVRYLDRVEYVRRVAMEDLLFSGQWENAMLKSLDAMDDIYNNAISVSSSRDRKDRLVVLMKDCLVMSGVIRIGSGFWIGSNGYYRQCDRYELQNMVYRVLFIRGAGASNAEKIGDPAVRAIGDSSESICRDVVRFKNCFYRFGKGAFRELKNGICVYGLDWTYRKNTPRPMFDRFLEQVLPDVRDRMCVQEFFGMIYIDRSVHSLEKFLMMIGNGANGKSVLLNIVSAAVGQPYISHLDPNQLRDYRQIVTMEGKRLNVAADVRASAVLSSAMKTLISGEKVEAWKMYAGNIDLQPPPIVFSMNEMPRTEDKSNGMIRRMLPVFFSVSIPEKEQDKELAHKIIESELPGVFDWMQQGRDRLLRNGGVFTQSTRSVAMSGEIVRKSVPIMEVLFNAGMAKEPWYDGNEPSFFTAKEIVDRFDLALSVSANKIAYQLRDAGFNSRYMNGRNNFIIYINDKL